MAGARVVVAASGERLVVGPGPLVAGAGALGLAAIVGAKLDPAFEYRWPLFWLHLLAAALVCVPWARDRWDGRRLRAALTRAELVPLGVVLALAAASSLAWLVE